MSRDSWRRPRGRLALIPLVALLALALASCRGPAPAAGAALHQWLADVQAHQVAYAYTLLTQEAEQRTDYNAFFAGVNASRATFKIASLKVISANEVEGTVAVHSAGAGRPTKVVVQVLEEGNGGDWLIGTPFSTKGADAIHAFQ
ncbi:MAG: hypothetical protein ACRENY_05795 [Candidatus Dormibacteria bacterium]